MKILGIRISHQHLKIYVLTCGSSSDISASPVCVFNNISITSLASAVNFSGPTANPIKEIHSIVLPRSNRSSVVVAFWMIYFKHGTNLCDNINISVKTNF